ncbi:MAG: OmpA family protein [Chitinophagia bacterium]|jgi:outer membrane protein OmpA-like peptidoglycan-associated protein/tetratricopeptide (TPR) repeat protein
MKNKWFLWVFYFAMTLVVSTHLMAQDAAGNSKTTISSKNKIAAQKLYDKAMVELDHKYFEKGIELLESAIQKNPELIDAYLTLFQTYLDTKQNSKAITVFEKAQSTDSLATTPFIVKYTTAFVSMGNYAKAFLILQPLINHLPSYLKSKATDLIKVCEFAMAHPTQKEIKVANVGDSINSDAAEYFPSVTVQDSLFLFMRRSNLTREDFYYSTITQNGFSKAKPLADNLNEEDKKGSMSLTQDLNTLYFAADYGTKGYGRYDIYKVNKTKKGWSDPKNLGRNINSDYWDSAPSIAPDGQALYFCSNRPGGFGGIDIYVAYRNEKGYWNDAVNLGPTINTAGDEQTPFIHADNRSLYFSSNGWPGFGGADLFVSRKKLDGTWSTPMNLGYPINTYENEGSIAVAGNGMDAYMASDRGDSKGGLDIYKVVLASATRANKTFYLKGYITDAVSKNPIAGDVVLVNPMDDSSNMHIKVDNNGYFVLGLPYFDSLGIRVNSPDHIFASTFISADSLQYISGTTYQFYLAPIPVYGNSFSQNFNHVYFDLNSAKLKKKSRVELDALVTYLESAPTAFVLIEGHTDSKGDSIQNKNMSDKRSESIAHYLISKKIAPNRVSTIGRGAKFPIADNATEEGRAKNRRSSFVISFQKRNEPSK